MHHDEYFDPDEDVFKEEPAPHVPVEPGLVHGIVQACGKSSQAHVSRQHSINTVFL